ncbi:BZ3500_MvSof-1268-A1-R1_Chr11-2g03413 [Microbotryum saponariae]|uniref:BZ3500_MvSof-1268-A1-R1_Chr11-2g03413 protein n=1 Tax=Microbotryum saponariae TaxID=289078 RepID=A0A2X0MTD9_9BASI|nr:BZ3500_MvSof-1268-A1-R1_Chr11-2g03413 [Microbotryum saponariae]SDA03324.1 BZ3501_MvSof-1269-A2-R1_Chr11g02984 [Microbotryum saponariae]
MMYLRLYQVFHRRHQRMFRMVLLLQVHRLLRRACELRTLIETPTERGPYNNVPKTQDSLALLLTQPNDRWFESKLRMSKTCFEYLVQLLSSNPVFAPQPTGRPQRPVREQIAVFLAYMGDPTSKLGSAVHTGIGEGSVYQYIDRVSDALYHHLPQVIRWPTGAEAARVSEALEVDKCIGVIDGTLLPLATAPFAKDRMTFYNGRKKMYCLNMQATVDDKRRFTSVDGGFPGIRHDNEMFRQSQIWRRRDVYFRGRKFLLGDKGYAQSAVLIRSFNQTEMNAMSPLEQRRANSFNKKFASKRIVVEHAFGDIKDKFRWLKLLAGIYHTPMWKYVSALMVLHNLLIDWNDSEGAMAEWIERGRHGEPPLIRPSTPEDVEFLRARDQQQLGPMAPRPNDAAIGKTTRNRVKYAFQQAG